MTRTNTTSISVIVAAVIALTMSTGRVAHGARLQKGKVKVEIPAAVAKAVKDNRPDATIDKLELENEAGVTIYDIEFKAGKGEIDVAADGTVIDIATIVKSKDVPRAALETILRRSAGAKIKQFEKSEVRAEVKDGKIIKFDVPKYVYEAELVKGNQEAVIEVTPDGQVVEAPQWKTKEAKPKE